MSLFCLTQTNIFSWKQFWCWNPQCPAVVLRVQHVAGQAATNYSVTTDIYLIPDTWDNVRTDVLTKTSPWSRVLTYDSALIVHPSSWDLNCVAQHNLGLPLDGSICRYVWVLDRTTSCRRSFDHNKQRWTEMPPKRFYWTSTFWCAKFVNPF